MNSLRVTANPDNPYCKTHKQFMRYRPKGVSKKTGKFYNAFYSCPVMVNGKYCKSTKFITP